MEKKCVLVTGSSKELGKEIILKFASNNYNVIINYLNHEKEATELKKYIEEKYKVKALCIKGDITKEEDINNMYNEIVKEFGNIDVLVNNAAIDITNSFNDKIKEDYLKVLDVNLVSAFLISRKFGNLMYENQKGTIINISSNNALNNYNEYSLEYDSSKAGLINLTHNLANHYSPYIRVNAVCPGWINTNETLNMNPNFIEEEKNKILLKRFAEKEEIANLVYFLASDEASYINDSIIKIDGGKTC